MSIPLAIVGYGKMGRMVEQFAPEYGFQVAARLDITEMANISAELLRGATAAIEFSNPAAAPDNLRRLAGLGVNTVCGTTGWYAELPQILEAVAGAKQRWSMDQTFRLA